MWSKVTSSMIGQWISRYFSVETTKHSLALGYGYIIGMCRYLAAQRCPFINLFLLYFIIYILYFIIYLCYLHSSPYAVLYLYCIIALFVLVNLAAQRCKSGIYTSRGSRDTLLINMMLNFSITCIRRNEEKQVYLDNHAT